MSNLSILNPYYNNFLESKYSGVTLPITYSAPPAVAPANTTVNTITNAFGNFILELVIEEFNIRYGKDYAYTDFGIVPIPNDQNSKCAYLIFPLFREEAIIIRTYIQLGNIISLDFNYLDSVESPDYLSTVTN